MHTFKVVPMNKLYGYSARSCIAERMNHVPLLVGYAEQGPGLGVRPASDPRTVSAAAWDRLPRPMSNAATFSPQGPSTVHCWHRFMEPALH